MWPPFQEMFVDYGSRALYLFVSVYRVSNVYVSVGGYFCLYVCRSLMVLSKSRSLVFEFLVRGCLSICVCSIFLTGCPESV